MTSHDYPAYLRWEGAIELHIVSLPRISLPGGRVDNAHHLVLSRP